MVAPSGEYAESRPFKIFISLLDKWEIGAPLTESLVFDSFKAIKRLIETADDGEDVGFNIPFRCSLVFIGFLLQVTMTASTLYEAVEPSVLWKQLLSAVFDEITGDGTQIAVCATIFYTTVHLSCIFRQPAWCYSS
jgi:hypothetical protein